MPGARLACRDVTRRRHAIQAVPVLAHGADADTKEEIGDARLSGQEATRRAKPSSSNLHAQHGHQLSGSLARAACCVGTTCKTARPSLTTVAAASTQCGAPLGDTLIECWAMLL